MENSWIERRIISYAHRGGAFESPSSTLGALEHSREVGVSALELDVHCTSDGVLICCHDSVVDTTTNGRGRVSRLSWDEIQQLNAGYWFVPGTDSTSIQARPAEQYIYRSPELQGEMTRLATVEDVLKRFPEMILNFDIKSTAPLVEPYEDALARLIYEFEARDRVIVSSFLDPAIWRIRQSHPSLFTSAAPGEVSEFYFALINSSEAAIKLAKSAPYVAFQIPRFFGEIELATPQFIEAAHASGKAVHIWTVNDPVEMQMLLEMGADAIISDRPTDLVDVISRGFDHYFYTSN